MQLIERYTRLRRTRKAKHRNNPFDNHKQPTLKTAITIQPSQKYPALSPIPEPRPDFPNQTTKSLHTHVPQASTPPLRPLTKLTMPNVVESRFARRFLDRSTFKTKPIPRQ
jgi:hypothetical protein